MFEGGIVITCFPGGLVGAAVVIPVAVMLSPLTSPTKVTVNGGLGLPK